MTIHVALAAALLAGPPGDRIPDREEGIWLVGETAHYVICVQKGSFNRKTGLGDRGLLEHLKSRMELLFEQYARAFKFKGRLEKKAVVRLHKDRGAYLAGGGEDSTSGHYDKSRKELVAYEDSADRGLVFQVLSHEGCHQFCDLVFPDFDDVPIWFREGLADGFGASLLRGKALYVFTLSGVAEARIPVIKEAVRRGSHTPIVALLKLSREAFLSKADLHYAQSWSFVHFLWSTGAYRKVVVRLIDGFKEGKPRDEVYGEAFRRIDLRRLEAQWIEYAKALRVRRQG